MPLIKKNCDPRGRLTSFPSTVCLYTFMRLTQLGSGYDRPTVIFSAGYPHRLVESIFCRPGVHHRSRDKPIQTTSPPRNKPYYALRICTSTTTNVSHVLGAPSAIDTSRCLAGEHPIAEPHKLQRHDSLAMNPQDSAVWRWLRDVPCATVATPPDTAPSTPLGDLIRKRTMTTRSTSPAKRQRILDDNVSASGTVVTHLTESTRLSYRSPSSPL